MAPQKSVSPFPGFSNPRYTPVPDELFDDLLPDLSGAELKVLLYIVRRTFGFKRQSDAVSIAQLCRGITTHAGKVLDRGTGLSNSTVSLAVKGLVEKGVLCAERRRDPLKGDIPTVYMLHMAADTVRDFRTPPPPTIGKAPLRGSRTQETGGQDTGLLSRRQRRRAAAQLQGPERYTTGRYPVCATCGIDPCECAG
jgi:hypothetical protein